MQFSGVGHVGGGILVTQVWGADGLMARGGAKHGSEGEQDHGRKDESPGGGLGNG